jgi:hypothetical protein
MILLTALFLAQVTVPIGNLTFSNDAVSSTQQYLLTQIVRQGGRLTAGVGPAATSLTYAADVSGPLVVGDVILIDAESMTVTAVTGPTLTVIRSTLGTANATHGNQSLITVLQYRSIPAWIKATILAAVSGIMEGVPAGTIATQNAAIVTAQAAKDAAKAASVQ